MNSSLITHHSSLFSVLSFMWGACVGSFLNVCIYRIPREISIVKPRSFCPHCNRTIPWYYNIPLISFLSLKAKCRYCGEKILFRYFLVELLTAVLFLLIWFKFGHQPGHRLFRLISITDCKLVPIYWLVISGLLLGTFIDFEHLIIPDRVTLGGILAGLILSAVVPALHVESNAIRALLWSGLGIVTGAGILWIMGIIGKMIFQKDAMGMGDVKLLGAIGAFLGSRAVLFSIMLSAVFGSIVGITLVLSHRKKMQSKIPYGPYLALAAVVWILWGPYLVDTYMDLVSPKVP